MWNVTCINVYYIYIYIYICIYVYQVQNVLRQLAGLPELPAGGGRRLSRQASVNSKAIKHNT